MAFNGGLEEKDEVMGEINMTPLVDVMLVLLIIFMITMPVMTHSMKVDLPQASSAPAVILPETINLFVGKNGQVQWNDMPVEASELENRLLAAAGMNPQPEIHIHGDRSVEYEYVAKTMAAVQRAGIRKLGFVTRPSTP